MDVVRTEHGHYLSGVQTCGSVWACPLCAPKIQAYRANELAAAVTAHDGQFVLVTLTLQHTRGQSLGAGIEAAYRGWRSITSGRGYKEWRDAVGLVGYVRALEITDGASGWHPHIHALLFVQDLTPERETAIGDYMAARWGKAVTARGYGFQRAHGIMVSAFVTPDAAAGAYLAKSTAFEVAYSAGKNGRQASSSPWGLLQAATDGDTVASARWAEYERDTKGRRALIWSRGLRSLLGLGVSLEDEEIAETSTTDGVVVWSFGHKEYAARAHLMGPYLAALNDGTSPSEAVRILSLTHHRQPA